MYKKRLYQNLLIMDDIHNNNSKINHTQYDKQYDSVWINNNYLNL